MQTRTYFANNIPSALDVARQELGEEALLVNSRPAPAHARQYGRLEVTFAWDPAAGATKPQQGAPTAVGPAKVPELDEIRRQLSALTRAVGYSGESDVRVPAHENPVEARLTGGGLSEETARSIAQAAVDGGGDLYAAALDELARRIPCVPFGEMRAGEARTLAFFGPPGRGKTTSLVKVAVTYGLARHVPVRIYSLGAHGVGGHEQIVRFAAILGAPFHAFDTVEQLGLALNGESWKGLILIDTPGMSLADQNELAEISRFFAGRQEVEKHLVLRGDARTTDSLGMVSRFGGIGLTRLMFAGMDESTLTGPAVEVAIRSGIPITFLGTGQQIPDDLEEAAASGLALAIWSSGVGSNEPQTKAARAAA